MHGTVLLDSHKQCTNSRTGTLITLRWRHNGCNSVSNHQPRDCLLSRLFRRRSKKTWKLRVTGLCVGNSPGLVNSRTKGQLHGKCFHLMTSSCKCVSLPNHTHLGVVTIITHIMCIKGIEMVQWREAYVLDNWQLAELPQSGGREFDPRLVHDNLSVPLWVYMRFPVPEHQN